MEGCDKSKIGRDTLDLGVEETAICNTRQAFNFIAFFLCAFVIGGRRLDALVGTSRWIGGCKSMPV